MNRFYLYFFWSFLFVSFVSGMLLLYFKYVYVSKMIFSVINHPLEPVVLKTHIIVSSIFVFFLGIIFALHAIPYFLKSKKRLFLGIILIFLSLSMCLSGYTLQVVSKESLLRVLALIHIVLGVLFVCLLPMHQFDIFIKNQNKK